MWTTFAASIGGAGAGLTGLMFIVVAFRFDTVAVSAEYRNRVAQSLSLFLTVTVTAALVTMPQPLVALGVELLLVGVAVAVLLTSLDAAARRAQQTPTALVRKIALLSFVSLLVGAGVLSTLDLGFGMHLYAASALLGVTWAVYGTRIYLTLAGLSRPAAE